MAIVSPSGARNDAPFPAAAQQWFADRIAPHLPGAVAYFDDTAADIWDHALLQGLASLMIQAGAVAVKRMPSDPAREAANTFSDPPTKVFVLAKHAFRAHRAITAVVTASPTTRVRILSSTPFGLLPDGSVPDTDVDAMGMHPREALEADLRGAIQLANRDVHGLPNSDLDADDLVVCEYVPVTWATLLPSFLVVGAMPDLSLRPSTLLKLGLRDWPAASTLQTPHPPDLAVAIFGLLESRDLNPCLWFLGDHRTTAAATVRELIRMRQFLNVSSEPGHPKAAVVLVDRALDLTPLFTESDHILSRVYRSATTSNTDAFVGLGPSASLQFAIPSASDDLSVPLCHHGGVVLEWMQLLVDFPRDGLSLLRKRLMDLGTRMRLLGKPTAAQFKKLLAGLQERSDVVQNQVECLLFAGLIATALDDAKASSVDQIIALQQSLSTILAQGPVPDLADRAADLLSRCPHRDFLPSLAVLILLQAMTTAPDLLPTMLDCSAAALANAYNEPDRVHHIRSQLAAWLAQLPSSPVPNLIRHAVAAIYDRPSDLVRHDAPSASAQAMRGFLGFSRLLTSEPSAPTECNEVIVCVTGPVSWPEVSLFRDLIKNRMAAFPHPDAAPRVTLVACGVEHRGAVIVHD
ncbi:hypothetical protein AMAG_10406 [Allomyces macrogynus ATCC 38327]|uniref:Sec1 family protein n=1 Tax=Allomyces macrogynus (strain ATCC 38327) TaxID=578462 RepID=A0A0L0SUL1_ALLM3|nr:hypothetical protein AMAG_10406 [Allomyces macrogynus ATCC 38327]|eukprot:KNE66156.1 hypothetical protein AMAG_10406 [Allomyces macrogynus ATCC 38327]